jgi:hypothetical protein
MEVVLKKLIFSLLVASVSITTQAATLCNPGGADPLTCKSKDGKFAIAIHDRAITHLGFSTNGFCDDGYIKINGIELNGTIDDNSTSVALENTLEISNPMGLYTTTGDGTKILAATAIESDFSDYGSQLMANFKPGNKSVDFFNLIVSADNKTAGMYFFNNGFYIKDSGVPLVCGDQ